MHKGVNYLAKMNSDTVFLKTTLLAKLFNISSKSDPFLLTAATPYMSVKRNPRKRCQRDKQNNFVEVPISISLLKRIKAADLVLLKERTIAQRNVLRFKRKRNRMRIPRGASLKPHTPKHFQNKTPRVMRRAKSRKPSNATPLDLVETRKPCYLLPLKMRDVDVPELLEWYQSKLPIKFAKSYCPLPDLLAKSQSGQNPIWLGYSSSKTALSIANHKNFLNIEGLAVAHIDASSRVGVKAVILHASVLSENTSELREFLEKLVDYVWRHVNCDEVRVELLHFVQGDKLGPYEVLKSEFQGLKFRWKTLMNDSEGNRTLVLGASRPEGKVFDKRKGLDCKSEPITFKHGVILSLTDKPIEQEDDECKPQTLYSLCSYLQILKEVDSSFKFLPAFNKADPIIESLKTSLNKLPVVLL
eukprot:TRINITY_DN8586_c0_g1_i1.p1 TRINITY_DN8586_c0_g1~~TRINITY_DN8586_c0_g1_i1.p1  ORF type:complete len:415 (-),score=54.22 TRINITY_DN8586_c0_g1_i1:884-2128(-)